MPDSNKPQLVRRDKPTQIGWVDPDPFKSQADVDEFAKMLEEATERNRKDSDH